MKLADLELTIEAVKRQLEYRARNTGVFNRKTTKIFHVEQNGFIYVIVNPILTEYDNDSRAFQRYNLSFWYRDYLTDGGKYMYEIGLYPILMPYLIMRIDLESGEIQDGHDIDFATVEWTEEILRFCDDILSMNDSEMVR